MPTYIYTLDMFKLYFEPHNTGVAMVHLDLEKFMCVDDGIFNPLVGCVCNWHALLMILGNRLFRSCFKVGRC